MPEDDRNLLIRLHRLASGEDENFLTESLAHLLRHLNEFDPLAALDLLQHLSGGRLILTAEDLAGVTISTQRSRSYGTPDIEIRSPDHLILIEAKVESDFWPDQLRRYRKELEATGVPSSTLTVLTRYPFIQNPNDAAPDVICRWHDLASWCEDLQIKNLATSCLVNQFTDFLRWRGVTMEPVSWELTDGIRSLRSLLGMVAEGLAANKVQIDWKSASWDWYGYYLEGKKFFIGVNFEAPSVLVFTTHEAPIKVSDEDKLELGRVVSAKWRNELDLSSEEVHFYARQRASQLQCIEMFIRDSVKYARTLVQ